MFSDMGSIPIVSTTSKPWNNWVSGLFTLYAQVISLHLVCKLQLLFSQMQPQVDKLLEEGDYIRLNKKVGEWDGIYWAIATAIYLGWSVITMNLQMTWIVWPIAGVIFAAYKEVIRMIVRTKL